MKYCELYKVKGLPVFQNKMFSDCASAQACPTGDIKLVQDMETGLIFNASFDESLLEYNADYQNEQACSGVFKQHLKEVKVMIQKHFADKSLIEVGCGKGYFLEYMCQAGYEITGIDPAYEGDNPHIIKAPFEPSLGLQADAIVMRHVLEHVENPLAFLDAIAKANGGRGKVYIEVPCFDWICEHRAWFDIFYEHVNYFRLVDFHRMFDKVYESGHVFGGQYLYVVADLATLQPPVLGQGDIFKFPNDFLSSIDRVAAVAQGKRNAIWGGASKGVIFALYMQRAGVDINIVIDVNPAKQEKYIASTGLKVLSPKQGMKLLQEGDEVFVMNSNYLQEIIALSNNKFNFITVDSNEF